MFACVIPNYNVDEKRKEDFVVALDSDDPLDAERLCALANNFSKLPTGLGKRLVFLKTTKSIDELVDLFVVRIPWSDRTYEGVRVIYLFVDDDRYILDRIMYILYRIKN